jgi:Domain of unknown function (DUF4760)
MALALAAFFGHVLGGHTDWPAWLAAIGALVTAGILVLTLGVAVGTLGDAKKTRHAQLIVALHSQWRGISVEYAARKLFGEYRDEALVSLVTKIYDPKSREAATEDELADWEKLVALVDTIEVIGVLRHEGALTYDLIYNMWGGGIGDTWRAWRPAIEKLREYTQEPDAFQWFEDVGVEIERRLAARS